MTPNVSIWLRAFRPSFQRAYPRPDETDRDFADLLRKAEERLEDDDPCTDGEGDDDPR